MKDNWAFEMREYARSQAGLPAIGKQITLADVPQASETPAKREKDELQRIYRAAYDFHRERLAAMLQSNLDDFISETAGIGAEIIEKFDGNDFACGLITLIGNTLFAQKTSAGDQTDKG